MSALADRSLGELLEQVAAESAAPGGGSSSALACALAAGLVEMTAAFTLARSEYADRHERMARVRARGGELRAEAVAWPRASSTSTARCSRRCGCPRDEPGRAQRVEAAMSEATDSPLAIARGAAETAELAAETAQTGNLHVHGDAVVGVLLAEAACAAAARLVELNLTGHPEDPRLEEAAELPRRALAARLTALSPERDV